MLSCAISASSDVHLNVEDLGNIQFYPTKTLLCRIQSLERLTSGVLRIIFRLPSNQQLDHHPGQYIDVIGKDGLSRSYSIANALSVEKLIELHIRQVATGAMSRYWFEEAKVDDLLLFSGSLGTFFIQYVSGLNLILLATGTGMTPIKAILQGMAAEPKEDLPSSISVCWGGGVPQDLYWSPTAVGLALQYFPALSCADDPGLLIRTGGESRISNFMLWQSACSELCFTDVRWPDFDTDSLGTALAWYSPKAWLFGLDDDKPTQCNLSLVSPLIANAELSSFPANFSP